MSFRDQLNPQQREAVETADGPLLILAGAGSGKTRVITYRIAHLVENLGVEPDSILAVTFTNKAAQEMAERVGRMVGKRRFSRPQISTFHSFCVRLLRRDIEKLQVNGKGLTRDFVIYDESEQQTVVKAANRRLGLDDKWMKPAAILGRISWAKNHMLDAEAVFLQSQEPDGQKIAHIFQEYSRALAKSNALDFDDLLLEAVRLLKAVPAVREHYHRKFQYILVDEYQDTNRPQYEVLRLLTGEHHNLCAVGDEDQSIYSWRGADIRNILEFERDFPNAKIVRLEQNYRSTASILQAASAVVAHNVKRKGKNLWTAREGGARIGYYEAPDGENEALFAADYMQKYLAKCAEEGRETHAAVLYRTNSQSRLFEESLRRYGLKYQIVGGFSFYERAEIKDMISYLKVVRNPDDSVALQRIVNTPARGLGRTSLEVIERIALETGTSLWAAGEEVVRRQLLPARALNALRGFREIIDDARAMLAGRFTERVNETATSADRAGKPANVAFSEEQVAFDLGELGVEAAGNSEPQVPETADDISFDFGTIGGEVSDDSKADVEPGALMTEAVCSVLAEPDGYSQNGQRLFLVPKDKWPSIQKMLEKLAKRASSLGVPDPRVTIVQESSAAPIPAAISSEYLWVTVEGELPVLRRWTFLGAIRHKDGVDVRHPLPGAEFPDANAFTTARCDHCHTVRRRHSTFIVRHENGELKQVGSDCIEDFVGHNADGHMRFAEAIFQLEDKLAEIASEARARLSAAVQSLAAVAGFPGETRVAGIENTQNQEAEDRQAMPEIADRGPIADSEEQLSDEGIEWWHPRASNAPASTAEILRFLLDRTGYIKQLEMEDSPESQARVENLRELVNAAMDAGDRGEDLSAFLDHAALVSDQDSFDSGAQITLMTLHAAKGLEFPLVFLAGLEEKLFPHSRTLIAPEEVEEERRLCYVGMTRAMDVLVLTRARYRRRWGTDMPEASLPSRFLEEVPIHLLEDLGSPGISRREVDSGYRYEDEDQRPWYERKGNAGGRSGARAKTGTSSPSPAYNSIDNIAEFFASRGKKFSLRPAMPVEEPTGARGFRPGQRVRHPKYGEGTVYRREGDGDDAKITVQFQRFGLKKLMEKYAQLERA